MTHDMYQDLERILYDRQTLEKRVAELGRAISADFSAHPPLMVCVLKGAVVFFSDLLKTITVPVEIDFMAASSYGGQTVSSGTLEITKDLSRSVKGEHLLLVEDIIDTGRTLLRLRDLLLSRGAAQVRIATLLDKPSRRVVDLKPDYCGFTIPDAFVVGYGLDYAEKYRNLPEVGILSPSAIRD